ncbi:hypothetical protein EUX98_g9560 [Antrodiella citrinella]|uniref:Uncharacterized protein n=1 Tax=Antrodiella citrinella TaxID=2447956 RepID=A0A4S4LRN0_9APHY|nr:hypothetical protein EUX98_g9560 [Antrodiella citrinella]
MNSIFSNKSLLPHLKRRTRTPKRDISSPSKAKPLDILPGLAEEDETRWSSSSSTSTSSSPSAYRTSRSLPLTGRAFSDVKRDSRRVVLTGVEGLSFDDFFPLSSAPPRPAPAPPVSRIESPLDDINLRFSGLGISMEFPSPPLNSRRDQSPTPSESSSRTSASASSTTSRKSSTTPPTSDDESSKSRLSRSPTCKSQRASVVFTKSTADMPKRTTFAPVSFVPEIEEEEEEFSDGEDASWYAEDISDIVTLSSMLPQFPATPTSATSDPRARPDSLTPPPRRAEAAVHRQSKALPVLPRISVHAPNGPSFQLDPSITSPYRRFIPSRPPPPPPIRVEQCSSPTMEEKTDELLELLANAALGSGFLGTGLRQVEEPLSTPVTPCSIFAISGDSRPPPRSAIPADISDAMEDSSMDGDDGSFVDLYYHSEHGVPMTPDSISVYSQASRLSPSPLSSYEFEVETPTAVVMNFSMLPESPDVGMYPSFTPPSTPPSDAPEMPERPLRSRWSSSTLSSFDASRQAPPSASSWMLRFHLPGSSPKSPKSPTHAKKPSAFKVPLSPTAKRSLDMDHPLLRRDSTNSNSRLSVDSTSASDSGDSTSSNGLRRKPIPVEIFMR